MVRIKPDSGVILTMTATLLLFAGGCAEEPVRYTPPPLHGDAPSYKNYPVPPQHDTIKPSPVPPEQWRALTDSAARSIPKKDAAAPPPKQLIPRRP